MYFKKLEIVGFKSFAEKTTIEFEAGVTAIVGPNGCGKSNISDSIRWVLGEQSAKSLRGGSMEDVIFNGSQHQEPLNLAEVSLTLSNESKILAIDYDEVTITRRLYRSGESEYLINKNTVRLRDIHELLMGTGIGTESYSIIDQGKMDLILNSKPEERREIFEEAAGITKYKSKKKEALRKLEQTDANLLRINDIIQEVKRQIGSIERQAKKAQVYQEEFERLKKSELQVASHEFLIFSGQKNDKDQSLEFLKQKEEESAADLVSSEKVYNEKKGLLDELESRLEKAQGEEFEISSKSRRDQDRALLNRERIGELCERKENLSRQIALSRKRADEFIGEYEKLNAEFEQARREEESGLVFLNSVESEFRAIADFIQDSVKNEESIKSQILDNARNRSANQNELSRLRAEIGTLDFRIRRIEDEKAQSLRDSEAVLTELRAFQNQINDIQLKLDGFLASRALAEKELSVVQKHLEAGEETQKNESLQESNLKAKIDFLNDLKNKQQGFLGGVKSLLNEKEKASVVCSGMAGVLVNLIQVEKGYELAVEAALEAYLQAVVFEKDEQVLEAVRYLRSSKTGRALLLSLEGKAGVSQSGSQNVPGGKSILSVIRYPQNLNNLMQSLLSGIFILPSAEEAYARSRENNSIVCVTREGERFEGQFVMGGSLSQDADLTLVGRQFRIEHYEEELKQVLAAAVNTKGVIEQCLADKMRLENTLKAASDSILSAQVELGDAKGRAQHLEERANRFKEEVGIFDREIALLRAEEEKLRESEKTQGAEELKFNQTDDELARALLALETAVKEKANKKEDLLVRLTEVRSKQSYFAAAREKIEKDKNWILESKSNEENQILLFEKESEECDQKKNALENENTELAAQIESAARSRDEILKNMEIIRAQREEMVRDLDAIEKTKDEKEAFLREAREKLHHYELESTKIQYEMDRLKERIFNAYQVDLAIQDAMQSAENTAFDLTNSSQQDLDALKAQIQAQREKLQKMGPVNLVAMQEFDEMRERFDFLTKQQADLVQAKDDLQKAIQKINRTTRELFVETFAQVQKNFTEYYKMLFGGGSAELVLLDEEDVLESGIEIVARPPGKKLQNISLLSGGEKALTAVALLFSLFKVKPSPFCILDEIDAPLDESNVDRFCSVLQDFINQSQFILITHNKRTMNLADAMYGITMQQTGISRIVSVKFGDKANKKKEENKAEVLI